jgi:prepilin-type N-terminal cleavage/methylation domain-containing protein
MKPRASKFTRAFTLLEILIALGILSLIVVAIYTAWYSIMKGSKVALDAAAVAQRERMTIRTLQDSMLCSCLYTHNARYYGFYGKLDDDQSMLEFVARLPKSFPRSGKFGDLDLRRLQFAVEPGPNGSKQLVLRQRPLLLLDFDEDEKNFPLVLARDVKSFLVEYADPGRVGNYITDWLYTNQLPKDARITIELRPPAQSQSMHGEKMSGFVCFPGQAVRPEWQVQPGLLIAPAGPGGDPNQTNGLPQQPGVGQPGVGQPGYQPGVQPGMPGYNPAPPRGGRGFGPGMPSFPRGAGGGVP